MASSSNRCIDLNGANTANGTKIQLWDNYNNDAQAWQVTSVGNGYYKILSKVAVGQSINRGWYVPNCVMDGSQNLQLWDYYGTSCQLFKFNYIRTKSAKASDAENVALAPAFEIYPNPSSDGNFAVSFSGLGAGDLKLCIYNLEGKKVYERNDLGEGDNHVISGLKPGAYILKANCSKYSFTQKLIVK